MHIDERQMRATQRPGANEVGWFAARQPGIVRFLEDRLLAGDGDAFGVALEGAWILCTAFRERNGLPPPRVTRTLLERAELAVVRESRYPGAFSDGCAERQPALCRWLAELVVSPPVPLSPPEQEDVGITLSAVIYALDELTTGRMVP